MKKNSQKVEGRMITATSSKYKIQRKLIYKELIQTKKNGQKNKYNFFNRERNIMLTKHMKRCSNSLMIKNIQIKAMRFFSSPM